MPHRAPRQETRAKWLPLAALAVLLLASCASTGRQETAALIQAREVYATASNPSEIFEFAASSMRQAKQHLEQAEQLLEDGRSPSVVDHHAFLAAQHVAIAEARLRRGLAQQAIEGSEERREALMLAAQERQATLAARRAEAIESELADTRMQLRMAEERAKAMAERLLELGVTSSLDRD